MTRHLPNAEGAPAGYIELEADPQSSPVLRLPSSSWNDGAT
jgi:hypothetical protein